MGADDLGPGPVRRRAALFRAAPPQDFRAALAGQAGQLLGGAGLADARFAYKHDQPPMPGERVVERGRERGHLTLPADKDVD